MTRPKLTIPDETQAVGLGDLTPFPPMYQIYYGLGPEGRELFVPAFLELLKNRDDVQNLSEAVRVAWAFGNGKWYGEKMWLEALDRARAVDPEGLRGLPVPEEFVLYRGAELSVGPRGFSWTNDIELARLFAWESQIRYGGAPGGVWKALVPTNDIFMLFGPPFLDEYEVVIDPRAFDEGRVDASLIETHEFDPSLSKLDLILLGAVRRESPLHGEIHWRCVAATALELARQTPGADPELVFYFGLLHDVRRQSEGTDPGHGLRAAEWVLAIKGLLGFSEPLFALLRQAIAQHSDGLVSDDPTIGVCWDADRLHLPRVGITPNPKLLSTAAARRPEALVAAERLRSSPPSWEEILAREDPSSRSSGVSWKA